MEPPTLRPTSKLFRLPVHFATPPPGGAAMRFVDERHRVTYPASADRDVRALQRLGRHPNKGNIMVVRILLAFALVACCVAATIAGETSAESKDDSKIESVREANTKFYAALNSMFTGELQPMSEVWSHSANVTYLGPDGSFRQGWKETLADWQKQAEMKLGGKVEPQNVRITVGSELAVVHNYEVGRNTVDGKETKVKIRATNVYRKEDGQWKMIGHHTDLLKFLEE